MTEIPAETKERVYEWEQMEIGHDAPVLTKEITQELITNFASSVQDESPDSHHHKQMKQTKDCPHPKQASWH